MKKLSILLVLIITIFAISACQKKAPDTTTTVADDSNELSISGEEVTIGILPAESSIPIILAKELGYFDELGLKLTIQAFSSPNDRNVAVQAKELDGFIADVMTIATFVDKQIPLKITSDISEDFKILTSPNSGITSQEGLNGKRISLVPNFILEYIMDEYAKQNNFTYEIVEIASFSGRAEALLSDQIDGLLFTEPQAGMLVKQGAHLIASSKELGIKGGTLSFTEDMIKNRKGDLKAFYEGYNKAVDYMNNSDVSEYSEILTNYQFPTAITEYLSNMTDDFSYAGQISKEQFDNIITWTLDKGQISNSYTFEELTDFSYLP